jgi:hypothetical protein
MRPEAHHDLSQQVDKILNGSSATISEFMGNVDDMLRKQGIEVEDIEGRPKSLASIREKQEPSANGTVAKVCSSSTFLIVQLLGVPSGALVHVYMSLLPATCRLGVIEHMLTSFVICFQLLFSEFTHYLACSPWRVYTMCWQ